MNVKRIYVKSIRLDQLERATALGITVIVRGGNNASNSNKPLGTNNCMAAKRSKGVARG